jgi:branched-chain amino acid transport system substrate-binding protein
LSAALEAPLKKRGASTSAVIGSLIVGLLIGAGVIYAAAPSLGLTSGGGTATVTTTVGGTGGTVTTTVGGGATVTTTVQAAGSSLCKSGSTIQIGALNDLSGQLSSQGQGDYAAEQVGITDVNNFVASAGCTLKFALVNNDYKLDTPTALSQLQNMYAAGIQVVIGPLNSGTAKGILQYANSNHIVLISPSSTSPLLHVSDITNNYLFRTAPNDAAQGQAVARELLTYGAKAVVIVNRDDTYGGGLANATKSFLMKDGMSASNIAGPIAYDYNAKDYSALLTQIATSYNSLNTGANAGHTYIFCISFQELGTILAQARTSSSSIYNDVPWFGSDGTAQNTQLTNTTTGPDVSHVKLPSTLFDPKNNSKTAAFVAELTSSQKAAIASNFFYSLEGYNDVWLAALSILAAGQNSGTAVHAVFPSIANSFWGVTGWEGITGNDRQAGSYEVWSAVSKSGGGYTWILSGVWDYNTDQISWTNNTPP